MRDDNTNTTKKIKPRTEKKPPKKLSERYLRNAGEYYLNRFPASSAHFKTVMTRKIDRSCRAHPEQEREPWIAHVQDTVIPYFEKLGFLNDDLFSQALYQSLKKRGLSRSEITRRMSLKGVDRDRIKDLLTDSEDGVDDLASVLIFAKKKKIGKFRTLQTDDPIEKRKDLGKLARAGFSYDAAMRAFE